MLALKSLMLSITFHQQDGLLMSESKLIYFVWLKKHLLLVTYQSKLVETHIMEDQFIGFMKITAVQIV